MGLKFRLLLLACLALVPGVAVTTWAEPAALRLDCGSEQLLEEGACVLTLYDTDVVVSSSGAGSINTLTVRLGDSPEAANTEIDGMAYSAEIADINVDERPEVFVAVASAGSGSYGSLVAYVVEADLSLSPIALPELGEDPDASRGYMGHDKFAVIEGSLVRRFPVYQQGDVNAEPTGGTRNLVYKLEQQGEQWQLRLDRSYDY